jgi:hypothetical protein
LLLALTYCLHEAGHFFRFGHFFPLGLHADVVVSKADYGIPGISKVYEAKLTNFGITLVKVTVCDFIDDAMMHGTEVGISIEKWSPLEKRWEDIFKDVGRSSWCHPFPLGIVEAQVTTKKLWPFQSTSGGQGAIAGYDAFAIGDRARFVIFSGNRLAIPTAAFSIDEQRTVAGVPYRVRH